MLWTFASCVGSPTAPPGVDCERYKNQTCNATTYSNACSCARGKGRRAPRGPGTCGTARGRCRRGRRLACLTSEEFRRRIPRSTVFVDKAFPPARHVVWVVLQALQVRFQADIVRQGLRENGAVGYRAVGADAGVGQCGL